MSYSKDEQAMVAEKIINVQDAFLNYLRKNKVSVTIFLLNGVKLNGVVSSFDKNVIVLKREGYIQLIYKHAISTFCPHGAINVFDWNGPVAESSESAEQPEGQDEAIETSIEIVELETTTYEECT